MGESGCVCVVCVCVCCVCVCVSSEERERSLIDKAETKCIFVGYGKKERAIWREERVGSEEREMV
jgi:hypothetical protein